MDERSEIQKAFKWIADLAEHCSELSPVLNELSPSDLAEWVDEVAIRRVNTQPAEPVDSPFYSEPVDRELVMMALTALMSAISRPESEVISAMIQADIEYEIAKAEGETFEVE